MFLLVTCHLLLIPAFLFVPQCFDWIEPGGFPCGPETEDDADADRSDEAGDGCPDGHVRGDEETDQERRRPADEQAQQTAEACQSHRFDQELPEDVAAACADRLARADLARAL